MEPLTTTSASVVHLGGRAVDDHHRRAGVRRRWAPGRQPGRRRASSRRRGAGRTRRRPSGPAERSWATRLCPKLMVADFRIPPQSGSAGVGPLAGPHPVEDRPCRLAMVAAQADDLRGVAVDLDDPGGVGAGLLVETVDVLGHQGVQAARALEGDQRPVPGVGLRIPQRRGRGGSARPGGGPRDRSRTRRRVAGRSAAGSFVHTPVGPPEVGDPRVGGDPRPGQDHRRRPYDPRVAARAASALARPRAAGCRGIGPRRAARVGSPSRVRMPRPGKLAMAFATTNPATGEVEQTFDDHTADEVDALCGPGRDAVRRRTAHHASPSGPGCW